MDLIGVHVVYALVVLVVKQHPADVGVGLLHALLEGFYFGWIFHIDDVLVGVLEGELIAKRIRVIGHRLPVFGQQRRYACGGLVPHLLILFLTLLYPINQLFISLILAPLPLSLLH